MSDATNKPSKLSIGYDLIMLALICLDLFVIVLDALLMSGFMSAVADLLGFSHQSYQQVWHPKVMLAGGLFTIFLIVEILVRWALAVIQKRYYRWFFFPFVHWYEVLSCFPQLRALRLLRVVVTGYRLYQIDVRFLPESWIARGKFYYGIVLEEVSDRVVVTALSSLQNEIKHGNAIGELSALIVEKHQSALAKISRDVAEGVTKDVLDRQLSNISQGVSVAVARALKDVPELKRYLRLIPVAGKLIESEVQQIGSQIGERIATELIQEVTKDSVHGGFFDEFEREINTLSVEQNVANEELQALTLDLLEHISLEINKKQWKNS